MYIRISALPETGPHPGIGNGVVISYQEENMRSVLGGRFLANEREFQRLRYVRYNHHHVHEYPIILDRLQGSILISEI